MSRGDFLKREYTVCFSKVSLQSLWDNAVFWPFILGSIGTIAMYIFLFIKGIIMFRREYNKTNGANAARIVARDAILNQGLEIPGAEYYIINDPWADGATVFVEVMSSPVDYFFVQILNVMPWYIMIFGLGALALVLLAALCFCVVMPYIRPPYLMQPHPYGQPVDAYGRFAPIHSAPNFHAVMPGDARGGDKLTIKEE